MVNNAVLLNKLGKLSDRLSEENLFYVVFGGVAVDGFVGMFTRKHSDVDFLCFREDVEKIENVLEELGYETKKFNHPMESGLMYKIQTGGEDHLISFQIMDRVGRDNIEISFYRTPHLILPLNYIDPPILLKLDRITFPAVSIEMLVKLKKMEVEFFEKEKLENAEKYLQKHHAKHKNTIHDLGLLK